MAKGTGFSKKYTGAQLRAARAMANLSQVQLAELSGVSVETIKRLEATDGRLKARIETLQSLYSSLSEAGVAIFDDMEGVARVSKRERTTIMVIELIANLTRMTLDELCDSDPKFFDRPLTEAGKVLMARLAERVNNTDLWSKTPPQYLDEA